MTTEAIKAGLMSCKFYGKDSIGIRHDVVAREVGCSNEELLVLVKPGLKLGSVTIDYRESNSYVFFTSDAWREKLRQDAKAREEAGRAVPNPARGSVVSDSGDGPSKGDRAPASTVERDAFLRGRSDAAAARGYARGVEAETQKEDRKAIQGGAPGMSPTAGPFTGRVAREEVDARSRREWDGDPRLRGEFPSFEAFAAFRRAEASGHIGVFNAGTVHRLSREEVAGERLADTAR